MFIFKVCGLKGGQDGGWYIISFIVSTDYVEAPKEEVLNSFWVGTSG